MKFTFSAKWVSIATAAVLVLFWLVGWYWSLSPNTFNVAQRAQEEADGFDPSTVAGFTLTTTMIDVSETLLNKPGGYLSNDVTPPSIFLDDMPAWEFGALEMVRDLALSMRKDFSRSQSQSIENEYLTKAHPKFNMDHRSWLFPSSESSYDDGIELLKLYRQQLADTQQAGGQFYTRADNLRDWLKQVEKRLGSYSQRLSASVGSARINTDLAGDAMARQSSPSAPQSVVKTSWWKLDDNFYEARGATWALLHFLKAVEIEFADVLDNKNAKVSLQQIIRELEATQQTVYSPVILNGSGFGMLANHSLVMANYISRANAALIELSELLNQG